MVIKKAGRGAQAKRHRAPLLLTLTVRPIVIAAATTALPLTFIPLQDIALPRWDEAMTRRLSLKEVCKAAGKGVVLSGGDLLEV